MRVVLLPLPNTPSVKGSTETTLPHLTLPYLTLPYPVLKHPQFMFFPKADRPCFAPIQKKW